MTAHQDGLDEIKKLTDMAIALDKACELAIDARCTGKLEVHTDVFQALLKVRVLMECASGFLARAVYDQEQFMERLVKGEEREF